MAHRDGFHNHKYPDGSVYEGEWLDGQKHGNGTKYYASGGRYTGQFYYGLRHGQGSYTYPDGDVYIGEFKLGSREGHGRYIFGSGGHYEGKWHEDKMHGPGNAVDVNGKILSGSWKAGRPSGTCWVQEGSICKTVTYSDEGVTESDRSSTPETQSFAPLQFESFTEHAPDVSVKKRSSGRGPDPFGDGLSWLSTAITCLSCTTCENPSKHTRARWITAQVPAKVTTKPKDTGRMTENTTYRL